MKYLKSLISILLIANLTHAQDKLTKNGQIQGACGQ